MHKKAPPLKNLFLAPIITALVIFSGCETTTVQEVKEDRVYTFYPSAPNPARYQYLTSFSSESDLGEIKKESSFASFIMGEEEEEDEVSIIKPYGIDLHDNQVYICDTIAFAIDIVDLEKKTISLFRPSGEGRLGKPANIAVDKDGTRYVADTGWGVVLVYDKNGGYTGSIGTRGETKPSDVVVVGDKLYMTDLQQKAVRVLDKNTHEELLRLPRDGDAPESQLYSPTNIAIGKDGKIYVSDTGGFHVKIYSENGEYLQTIGSMGTQIGGMVRPKGVDVDRDGRIYVVDAATEVVQVFNSEGKLLLFFGETTDSDLGFELPATVKIDYDNIEYFREYIAPDFDVEYLVFVTSQYGPRKISVFGYGSRKADRIGSEG
jgi:DNA-binding beta-propeller fold protein YncE